MSERNLILADVIRHASQWLAPNSERRTSCSLLLLEKGDPTALHRLQAWAREHGAKVVINEAVTRATKEQAARAATVDVIVIGQGLDLVAAMRKKKP